MSLPPPPPTQLSDTEESKKEIHTRPQIGVLTRINLSEKPIPTMLPARRPIPTPEYVPTERTSSISFKPPTLKKPKPKTPPPEPPAGTLSSALGYISSFFTKETSTAPAQREAVKKVSATPQQINAAIDQILSQTKSNVDKKETAPGKPDQSKRETRKGSSSPQVAKRSRSQVTKHGKVGTARSISPNLTKDKKPASPLAIVKDFKSVDTSNVSIAESNKMSYRVTSKPKEDSTLKKKDLRKIVNTKLTRSVSGSTFATTPQKIAATNLPIPPSMVPPMIPIPPSLVAPVSHKITSNPDKLEALPLSQCVPTVLIPTILTEDEPPKEELVQQQLSFASRQPRIVIRSEPTPATPDNVNPATFENKYPPTLHVMVNNQTKANTYVKPESPKVAKPTSHAVTSENFAEPLLPPEETPTFLGPTELDEMEKYFKDSPLIILSSKNSSTKTPSPKSSPTETERLNKSSPQRPTFPTVKPKKPATLNATSPPKNTSPKDNSPKDNPPIDYPPKDNKPKDNPPKDNPPKEPPPKEPSPKDLLPKIPTPKDSIPETAAPKAPSPKDSKPKETLWENLKPKISATKPRSVSSHATPGAIIRTPSITWRNETKSDKSNTKPTNKPTIEMAGRSPSWKIDDRPQPNTARNASEKTSFIKSKNETKSDKTNKKPTNKPPPVDVSGRSPCRKTEEKRQSSPNIAENLKSDKTNKKPIYKPPPVEVSGRSPCWKTDEKPQSSPNIAENLNIYPPSCLSPTIIYQGTSPPVKPEPFSFSFETKPPIPMSNTKPNKQRIASPPKGYTVKSPKPEVTSEKGQRPYKQARSASPNNRHKKTAPQKGSAVQRKASPSLSAQKKNSNQKAAPVKKISSPQAKSKTKMSPVSLRQSSVPSINNPTASKTAKQDKVPIDNTKTAKQDKVPNENTKTEAPTSPEKDKTTLPVAAVVAATVAAAAAAAAAGAQTTEALDSSKSQADGGDVMLEKVIKTTDDNVEAVVQNNSPKNPFPEPQETWHQSPAKQAQVYPVPKPCKPREKIDKDNVTNEDSRAIPAATSAGGENKAAISEGGTLPNIPAKNKEEDEGFVHYSSNPLNQASAATMFGEFP